MAEVIERVQAILGPILDSLGLFLWDMEFKREGPRWLLRIYIDRESGVTIEDCEAVSRDLGAQLDVEDIITHSYTLEVSSPGLDRTLSRPEHFQRFVGSRINVKTFQPVEGAKVFRAEIVGLEAGTLRLRLENGADIDTPLANIAKASLEVEI